MDSRASTDMKGFDHHSKVEIEMLFYRMEASPSAKSFQINTPPFASFFTPPLRKKSFGYQLGFLFTYYYNYTLKEFNFKLLFFFQGKLAINPMQAKYLAIGPTVIHENPY